MKNYFVMTDAIYLLSGNEGSPKIRKSLVSYHSVECIQDITGERPSSNGLELNSRVVLKCGEDFLSQIKVDQWARLLEQINQYFEDEDSKEDKKEGSEDNGKSEESSEESSS